ncbi:hypothetical protein AAGQ96_05440 [Pantoea sp. MBD-2R]|uniref:hypothetical protein n=1 Tax=unclassified Pantoea TaxID=2630326 RepID=UPI0011BEE47F|nr:hypothetical protein [Pantoea sp. CCBC3-3-1]
MRKRIPFSDGFREVNAAELQQFIQRIIPKIEDELTGSLQWYSQNAQYVPDSTKIISIEYVEHSRYKMNYSFCWRVFNPCLDIDSEQLTIQTVNFEWQPDALVFDFIDTEPASVADEL